MIIGILLVYGQSRKFRSNAESERPQGSQGEIQNTTTNTIPQNQISSNAVSETSCSSRSQIYTIQKDRENTAGQVISRKPRRKQPQPNEILVNAALNVAPLIQNYTVLINEPGTENIPNPTDQEEQKAPETISEQQNTETEDRF